MEFFQTVISKIGFAETQYIFNPAGFGFIGKKMEKIIICVKKSCPAFFNTFENFRFGSCNFLDT